MIDQFDSPNWANDSDQVKALKRLAVMYHGVGDYEKAEELLSIAEQWAETNRHTAERRQGDSGREAA